MALTPHSYPKPLQTRGSASIPPASLFLGASFGSLQFLGTWCDSALCMVSLNRSAGRVLHWCPAPSPECPDSFLLPKSLKIMCHRCIFNWQGCQSITHPWFYVLWSPEWESAHDLTACSTLLRISYGIQQALQGSSHQVPRGFFSFSCPHTSPCASILLHNC